MRTEDFGPVPVSRLKADASSVFEALERGRRVLVSRRGTVVAAIDPPADIEPHLLIEYALPGARPLAELTATEINRRSPSRAVYSAIAGDSSYVTKDGHVYGLLRPVTNEELVAETPTPEEISVVQSRIDEHLAAHPEATAADVGALSRSLRGKELRVETESAAPDESLVRQVRDLATTVDRLQVMVAVESSVAEPPASRPAVSPTLVAEVALEAANLANTVVDTAASLFSK